MTIGYAPVSVYSVQNNKNGSLSLSDARPGSVCTLILQLFQLFHSLFQSGNTEEGYSMNQTEKNKEEYFDAFNCYYCPFYSSALSSVWFYYLHMKMRVHLVLVAVCPHLHFIVLIVHKYNLKQVSVWIWNRFCFSEVHNVNFILSVSNVIYFPVKKKSEGKKKVIFYCASFFSFSRPGKKKKKTFPFSHFIIHR